MLALNEPAQNSHQLHVEIAALLSWQHR